MDQEALDHQPQLDIFLGANIMEEQPLNGVQHHLPRNDDEPELDFGGPVPQDNHQEKPDQEYIGDSDSRPELLQSRNPIRTQEGQQYEIKPRVIALVKQNQYHGLLEEDPLDHVDSFEELCSTTNTNGVPGDYLRCRLFVFTLAGKALKWLKALPSCSITTWRQFKKAFLGQFYTKQRANLMRSKISGFQQGPIEPYHEALERFKEYIRDCPQHGFSEVSLWNTFYEGCRRECKLCLDIASNGNFMSKSIEEAKTLIDNLATSDSKNQPSYEETIKAINTRPEQPEFKEIKSMISMLLERQPRLYQVCEEDLTPKEDMNQEVLRSYQRDVNFVSKRDLGDTNLKPHLKLQDRHQDQGNVFGHPHQQPMCTN